MVMISCGNWQDQIKEDVAMREKLATLIKQPQDTIDLSNSFLNEFDTLYIFPPYYLIGDIEIETGFNLEEFKLSNKSKDLADVDENSNLLLFRRRGALTKYFLFPRVNGDFSKATKHLYLPSESVFVKTSSTDSGSTWLYLIDVKR